MATVSHDPDSCLFFSENHNTCGALCKNRPENDLYTVIWTSYHCFTTVLMHVSVEYFTDLKENSHSLLSLLISLPPSLSSCFPHASLQQQHTNANEQQQLGNVAIAQYTGIQCDQPVSCALFLLYSNIVLTLPCGSASASGTNG